VRGDVPPEVRRVAEAYSRARPVGESGPIVAVPPAPGEAGVIIASGEWSETSLRGAQVIAHSVSDHVEFSALPGVSIATTNPPGDGWTPIVLLGGRAIVAVRESPTRQVWIGFRSPDFARTPGFVVFWTNVLDWVGQSGEQAFVESVTPVTPLDSAKPQAAGDAVAKFEIHLTPWVALLALFCVFFAVLAWPRGRGAGDA
jgi:hypothetical protein